MKAGRASLLPAFWLYCVAAAPVTVQLVLPPKSAPPEHVLDQLAGVATSPFAQNLGLLLATAVVTGLLVPRVKAGMDMRYFREQKQHEAELARQASLIAEQTTFLRSYIAALWRLHFNMIQVTYAKATSVSAAEFDALWLKYAPESWACLQEIRSLTSSAVHLVGTSQFAQMLNFYKKLLATEAVLSGSVDGPRVKIDWIALHHRLLNGFADELDAEIVALARELGLTATQRHPVAAVG